MSAFDYHVHTDLNLIEVHPSKVVQISDIVSYALEIVSLDHLTEGTLEYYDLSEVTELNLDIESAAGLIGILRRWISRGWQGSVFFTPQEFQFRLIWMMGEIVESIQRTPDVVMIPRREPTALGEVRAFIAECRQIS